MIEEDETGGNSVLKSSFDDFGPANASLVMLCVAVAGILVTQASFAYQWFIVVIVVCASYLVLALKHKRHQRELGVLQNLLDDERRKVTERIERVADANFRQQAALRLGLRAAIPINSIRNEQTRSILEDAIEEQLKNSRGSGSPLDILAVSGTHLIGGRDERPGLMQNEIESWQSAVRVQLLDPTSHFANVRAEQQDVSASRYITLILSSFIQLMDLAERNSLVQVGFYRDRPIWQVIQVSERQLLLPSVWPHSSLGEVVVSDSTDDKSVTLDSNSEQYAQMFVLERRGIPKAVGIHLGISEVLARRWDNRVDVSKLGLRSVDHDLCEDDLERLAEWIPGVFDREPQIRTRRTIH